MWALIWILGCPSKCSVASPGMKKSARCMEIDPEMTFLKWWHTPEASKRFLVGRRSSMASRSSTLLRTIWPMSTDVSDRYEFVRFCTSTAYLVPVGLALAGKGQRVVQKPSYRMSMIQSVLCSCFESLRAKTLTCGILMPLVEEFARKQTWTQKLVSCS